MNILCQKPCVMNFVIFLNKNIIFRQEQNPIGIGILEKRNKILSKNITKRQFLKRKKLYYSTRILKTRNKANGLIVNVI